MSARACTCAGDRKLFNVNVSVSKFKNLSC